MRACACRRSGWARVARGAGAAVFISSAALADVKSSPEWKEAKAFARDPCATIAADGTEYVVLNMAKRKRSGHICLDYLRNDRAKTAIAPLSRFYAPRPSKRKTVVIFPCGDHRPVLVVDRHRKAANLGTRTRIGLSSTRTLHARVILRCLSNAQTKKLRLPAHRMA
jgi:hypothetical protein